MQVSIAWRMGSQDVTEVVRATTIYVSHVDLRPFGVPITPGRHHHIKVLPQPSGSSSDEASPVFFSSSKKIPPRGCGKVQSAKCKNTEAPEDFFLKRLAFLKRQKDKTKNCSGWKPFFFLEDAHHSCSKKSSQSENKNLSCKFLDFRRSTQALRCSSKKQEKASHSSNNQIT